MGGGAEAAVRLPSIKTLLVALTVLVLVGTVLYAVRQEMSARAPSAAASFAAGMGMYRHAPPLTPDEEAYAAALWPVHSEVKLAAVRMIFAGLKYKTENADGILLRDTVLPLARTFESAKERTRQLPVPASLSDAHASYLEALDSYAWAAREMVKVAQDRSDRHLIAAQQRSERASLAILTLSDVLWPGEYKPN